MRKNWIPKAGSSDKKDQNSVIKKCKKKLTDIHAWKDADEGLEGGIAHLGRLVLGQLDETGQEAHLPVRHTAIEEEKLHLYTNDYFTKSTYV